MRTQTRIANRRPIHCLNFLPLLLILFYGFLSRAEIPSNLFIGNGTPTTGFTPVVNLHFYSQNLQQDEFYYCTGTQIEAGIILTAAHCVCDFYLSSKKDPKSLIESPRDYIEVNNQKVFDAKVRVHPNFSCETSGDIADVSDLDKYKYDLALIKISQAGNKILSDHLKELSIYKINTVKPKLCDDVQLVGYGLISYDGKSLDINLDEKKYFGNNHISSFTDNFIEVDNDLNLPNVPGNVYQLQGDSGGPLINLLGQVVGVASNGTQVFYTAWRYSKYKTDFDNHIEISRYVPLFTEANKAFLSGLGDWKD